MAEFFSVLFAPEFFTLHLVFLAVFGLLVGSFLNVCIYRIPAGMSIVHPGSHCATCGHYLKWFENIPVLSYLLQGGKCRRCGTPFSPRYMAVEIITAILFVWLFWVWRYNWATPLYLVFTGMLIVGTFTDIDHWIIPDSMTWGGAIVALAITLPLGFLGGGFHTAMSGPFILEGSPPIQFGAADDTDWILDDEGVIRPAARDSRLGDSHADVILQPFSFRFDARLAPLIPLGNAFVGAMFGFGLLWMVGFIGRLTFRKEAMGMGDMKLFAFIGAVVGWFNCLWVLVLACVLGIVFHFSMFLSRRIVHSSELKPAALPAEAPDENSSIGDEPPGDAESTDEAEEDLDPDREREQRVMAEILKQDTVSTPNLHPLPFGPYIAMAAYLVLLYHDRLNTLFRTIVLGIP